MIWLRHQVEIDEHLLAASVFVRSEGHKGLKGRGMFGKSCMTPDVTRTILTDTIRCSYLKWILC